MVNTPMVRVDGVANMSVGMPRNYARFNEYLNDLNGDIYAQPADEGHTSWAEAAIDWWKPKGRVLDIGCGTGFCHTKFTEDYGVDYEGITASLEDVKVAQEIGRKILFDDMTFLTYGDNEFDGVFARHVLEHSPFPIITLMEWRRVTKKELLLVSPAPEFWGWGGRNHYSVAYKMQIRWWLIRSGWDVILDHEMNSHDDLFIRTYSKNLEREEKGEKLLRPGGAPQVVEYWFLCEKGEIKRE